MLVGKKLLDEKMILELISDIKKKKELKELSSDFVREHLFKFLSQEKKCDGLKNKKSAFYKKTIKEVRAKLRKNYGLFREEEGAEKREELVEKLQGGCQKKRIVKELLKTHASTRERLDFYETLYKKIFAITGKPKTILDLGCGLNPFSIPLMKLKDLTYSAYDLSENEIFLLNRFFGYIKVKGKAEVLDVLSWYKFPKADLCFLFKMTALLDKGKGHKTTEKVVQRIPARYVVVSFATKTMSGKKMTAPERRWFQLMCKRLGYKFRKISFENELFYVVDKEGNDLNR